MDNNVIRIINNTLFIQKLNNISQEEINQIINEFFKTNIKLKSEINIIKFSNNIILNINNNILNNFNNIETLIINNNTELSIHLNEKNISKIYITNNNIKTNRLKTELSLFNFELTNLEKLKTLYINNNNISKITDNNVFSSLSQLETLNLSHNQLSIIDNTLFSSLSNLKNLNLSHNQLSIIDNTLFSSLSELEELDLSHNQLSIIDNTIFSSLLQLETLNLSHNQLSIIYKNGFSSLFNLINLNLSDNQLTNILFTKLDTVEKFKLINLKILNLNNNKIIINDFNTYCKILLSNLPNLIDLQIEDPQLLNRFNDELVKIQDKRQQKKKYISHIDTNNCNICINKLDSCNEIRKDFINNCLPFFNLHNSGINILNYDRSSYIYYDITNSKTSYLDYNFYLYELPGYNTQIIKYNTNTYNIKNLLSKIIYTTFNDIPIYYLFSDYNVIFNIFIYQLNNVIANYNNKLEENNKIISEIKQSIEYHINSRSIISNIKKTINELKDQIKTESDTKSLILQKQFHEKQLQQYIKEIHTTDSYILDESSVILYYEKINNDIKNKINLFNTVLRNLFTLNNNKYFISISYKFNIFNISLLCEKYKEIIDLFNYKYEGNQNKNKVEIIKQHLKIIFKNFNLANIYYLIHTYKTSIQGVTANLQDDIISKDSNDNDIKKNIFNIKFIDNIIADTNNKKKNEYKTIINQEQKINNIDKITIIYQNTRNEENIIEYIYNMLSVEIIVLQRILNDINKIIPEFKTLFFMAILTYRFKNTLLNGTWGFNKQYIYNLINKNSKDIYFNNPIKSIYFNTICLKYFSNEKPIIYEYDKVTYKNITYGNCMENVILQFFKIIFWNDQTEIYDDNIINTIIKPEYIGILLDFFNNINNEKSKSFILDWVTFITELSNDEYDFLNKPAKVELNPTFNNLIIALKKLTLNTFQDETNIKFIEKLITTINADYKIKIQYLNEGTHKSTDKIILHTNKLYYINLIHNAHGGFQLVSQLDTYFIDLLTTININITPNIDFNYIYNQTVNIPIKISNLNAFIYYSFASNKDDLIFKNYIINYIEPNEIIKYFNILFIQNSAYKIPSNIISYIETNLHLLDILPKDVFMNYDIILTGNILQKIIDNELLIKFDFDFNTLIRFMIIIFNKFYDYESTNLYIINIEKIIDTVFYNFINSKDMNDSMWIKFIEDCDYGASYLILTIIIKYNNNIIIDNWSNEVIKKVECIKNAFRNNITAEKHTELLNKIENMNSTDWTFFFRCSGRKIDDRYFNLFILNYTIWTFNHWKIFIWNNKMSIDCCIQFIDIIKLTPIQIDFNGENYSLIDIINKIIQIQKSFDAIPSSIAIAIFLMSDIFTIPYVRWLTDPLYESFVTDLTDYIQNNMSQEKKIEYYTKIKTNFDNIPKVIISDGEIHTIERKLNNIFNI